MTTEQEIKTIVEVLRRIAKHAMAGTGHEASEVSRLLDSIDRDDGEKPAKPPDLSFEIPPDPTKDNYDTWYVYAEKLVAQRDAMKRILEGLKNGT